MAELPVYPSQRHSDGILEVCFMPTELRKNCCVTRSPRPNNSHVKISFGWWSQLLLTVLCGSACWSALHNRESFWPSLPKPGSSSLLVAAAAATAAAAVPQLSTARPCV